MFVFFLSSLFFAMLGISLIVRYPTPGNIVFGIVMLLVAVLIAVVIVRYYIKRHYYKKNDVPEDMQDQFMKYK